MEIALGLQGITKSLNLKLDLKEDEIQEKIQNALNNPEQLLEFTDTKGRKIVVNPKLIAYCEIETAPATQVGFGIG